ncbi:MAG: DUF1134 domain-containing protein [Erythrobacter sp.]
MAALPAGAQQMESVDPDQVYSQQNGSTGAIDGDLASPPERSAPEAWQEQDVQSDPGYDSRQLPDWADPQGADTTASDIPPAQTEGPQNFPAPDPAGTAAGGQTYGEDDLIGAAEGLFGKGAQGLARMIEDLLKDQGEPNGYIVGREAGGAFIFGARYGSGTLHHRIEGQRQVYWTGPSLGFDAGANAANTFVLVYNLYDSEDIFRRYPAGEGQAYFVGGLHASYMRRGDVVLIPIRMGAGLRLGVNAGYMRFSKKQRWLPF